MAENVPVTGHSVPPVPAGAQTPVSQANMQPGFVSQVKEAPAQGFTQEQVQAQIDAALKAAQPQQAAPATPAAFEIKNEASNDPVLASFTDVFLKVGAGMDMDRAIGKALTYGNPALIDSAYIAEKGGANAAQLATLAKAIVERVQAQTAAASSAVYDTAGGQPQWDAAAAVFDKSAPPYLKQVIAKMLDSGDTQAIKGAAQMVVEYVQKNGLVVNPAQLIHAGATGGSAAQALDKAGFQEAHAKLNPNSRTYIADRQELFARRQLGKQLGK